MLRYLKEGEALYFFRSFTLKDAVLELLETVVKTRIFLKCPDCSLTFFNSSNAEKSFLESGPTFKNFTLTKKEFSRFYLHLSNFVLKKTREIVKNITFSIIYHPSIQNPKTKMKKLFLLF